MLLLQHQQQDITCRQARVRKLEQQLQYTQYELHALDYEHRETERQLRLIQTQDIWVSADEHHTITHYRQLISNQLYRKRCQVQQLQEKINQEATDIRHECHLWLQKEISASSPSSKKKANKKKTTAGITNNTIMTPPPPPPPTTTKTTMATRKMMMNNNSSSNGMNSTGSGFKQEAAIVQYPSFVICLGNKCIRWQDYLGHIVHLRSSNQRKFADMFLWSSSTTPSNHHIKRKKPPPPPPLTSSSSS